MVIYEIDGERVRSLADFTALAGEAVGGPGAYFGGNNLDAFSDCLKGGYGTPEDDDYGFRLRNADAARPGLGYEATAAWLRNALSKVHPTSRAHWESKISDAEAGRGETLFDIVVTIFDERGVPLRLEEN